METKQKIKQFFISLGRRIKANFGWKSALFAGICIILLAADLLTKHFAEADGWRFTIIPKFLEIVDVVHNDGASLGMGGGTNWALPLFITLTFIMVPVFIAVILLLPVYGHGGRSRQPCRQARLRLRARLYRYGLGLRVVCVQPCRRMADGGACARHNRYAVSERNFRFPAHQVCACRSGRKEEEGRRKSGRRSAFKRFCRGFKSSRRCRRRPKRAEK